MEQQSGRKRSHLGSIGLALMLVAVLGFATATPGQQSPAFVAILAIMLLLQLPAVMHRMRGGSVGGTWLIAFLMPFLPFELLLGTAAAQHGNMGGDLQGIEAWLMLYVVPPAVAISATVVTVIATLCFPRAPDGY